MTYVITGACIDSKDRSCLEVCPVDCIYEADAMLVIAPDECIDCGACEVECPVQAIHPDDQLPHDGQAFLAINAAIAAGPGAVDDALRAHLAASAADGAR